MARIVVWLIGRLGRYAVLVLLLAAGLVGYGWLLLFDRFPYAALAAAFVVVPFAMAAVALAIGVLLAPSAPLPKTHLSREDAPRLWALWDEVDPKCGKRRLLVVDDELNASMAERRGPLGLRRTEIMTVGLPLMMVCDEAAIKAIMAHEVGHARLAHVSGLANIHDFVGSFDLLFQHADPGDTIVGALVDLALSGGMERLKREMRTVSRRHEFEADSFAGALKPDMARALVLLRAARHSADLLVFKPLEKELLGAMSPPPSPLSRIAGELAEIHRRGVTATALLDEPQPSDEEEADLARYGSTHPEFDERLKSLGFDAPPEIARVMSPASATLMPPETRTRLTEAFEAVWLRRARRHLAGED